MSEPDRSLYSKLAEVMAEVEHVAKRGRNDFHKYDYATEADITSAVRKGLAERRVMILPACIRSSREPIGKTKSGNTIVLTRVDMSFTLTDGESGEKHVSLFQGEGADEADKGMNKAYTAALKYFLLKTFLIPTGDDPEAADPTPVAQRKQSEAKDNTPDGAWPDPPPLVRTISRAQRKEVFDRAKAKGMQESELKALLDALTGQATTEGIPLDKLDSVLEEIGS